MNADYREEIPAKNPRGGVKDTLARGEEKVRLALEWIAIFHFSTLPIIAKRLKISENTAFRFIKKLKAQGLIRGFETYVIRRELLMLTVHGLGYCTELTERIFNYSTEPSKVSLSRVRHDLIVQEAVADRVGQGDSFCSDRQLGTDRRSKIPDALIEKVGGQKIALEIELTPKTDERIYIGFENHLKALHESTYDRVVYLFKTKTLHEYYLKRFESDAWPAYTYSEKLKRWVLKKDVNMQPLSYYPRDDEAIIEKISFMVI